jgi:hypothetical protein
VNVAGVPIVRFGDDCERRVSSVQHLIRLIAGRRRADWSDAAAGAAS